jgi:hypothetical protein
MFDSSVNDDEMASIAAEIVERGGHIHHRFGRVLRGFSATIPAEYAELLRQMKGVTLEADGVVTAIDGMNKGRGSHGASSHERRRHSPRNPSP